MKAIRLLFYQFIMLNTKRRKFLTALSCVVVFCTVYALIIPAITMSKSNPTLAADRTQGAPGETLAVQVSAEADNTQEERIFLLSATGDNAGLDDSYVFDEYGVTNLLDDNGNAIDLHRDLREDGSLDYWFQLSAGERTQFSLLLGNGTSQLVEQTTAESEETTEDPSAAESETGSVEPANQATEPSPMQFVYADGDKSASGALKFYAVSAATLKEARESLTRKMSQQPDVVEFSWSEQVAAEETEKEDPEETDRNSEPETGDGTDKESGTISGSVSEKAEVKIPRTKKEPAETTDTDKTGTKISGKVSQRAPRKALTYIGGTALTVRDDIKNSGHLATNVNSLGDGETVVWYKQTVTGNETPSTNGWEEVSRIKVTGDHYNMGEGTTADNAWVNPTLDGGAKTETTTTYYRAVVVNSSGQTLATSDAFAVPYYATIQNGSFEYPVITSNFNWFIKSGTNGIVWKTTATNGSGNHNIEIARTSPKAYNAYHTNRAADGNQFAELNSDAAGALYQDVLTTPRSTMYWQLCHRARDHRPNTTNTDTMYVVIMSTKLAEEYNITTQAKVSDVINNPDKYPGARVTTIADDNRDWYFHEGDYLIPEDQFMTRYFFVAGRTAANNVTLGNLLDSVSFSTELPPPSPNQARFEVVKTFDSAGMTTEEIAALQDNLTFTLTYTITEKKDEYHLRSQYSQQYDYFDTSFSQDKHTITINLANHNMNWTVADGVYTGTYVGSILSIPVKRNYDANSQRIQNYYRYNLTYTTEYTVTEDTTTAELADYDRTTSVTTGDSNATVTDDNAGVTSTAIPTGENTVVTFNNEYQKQTGSLSFTKVDEKTNPLPGAEFALYTDKNCTTPLEINSAAVTTTSDENGKVLFENIPVGTYYVKETNPPENYQEKTMVYEVTITKDTEAKPVMDGKNQVTNERIRLPVMVKKVDATDTEKLLSGAVFALYGSDYMQDGIVNNAATPMEENLGSDANGIVLTKTELAVGTYYLVETKAPNGYNSLDTPVKITVSADNVTAMVVSGGMLHVTTNDDGVSTITVPNSPGYELPATGGIGTRMFEFLGAVLMGLGLIGLWRKRKA